MVVNHNHNHCEHEVKHCRQCNVAYCAKCGEEWGRGLSYVTTTPSWYSTRDMPITVTNASHTHT